MKTTPRQASGERHALVVTHLYPSKSADCGGIFIHRLNLGLQHYGWRVSVLQLIDWAPPGPLRKLTRAWEQAHERRKDLLTELDGVRVHHPQVFTPRPSRFFPADQAEREVRALVNYCRAREDLAAADIVLGHFLVPDGYHALRLGRSLGIPAAAMGWGIDVDEWPRDSPLMLRRLREAMAGLDVPIACSKKTASQANAFLGAPRADWEIVYAGVDLQRFHPDRDQAMQRREAFGSNQFVESGTKILLMIARPVRLKGYLEILDVWKEVAQGHPEWHLVMTGSGSGDLDVQDQIQRRDLVRAHWLGSLPVDSVPALLGASDAFVLPSHHEGLSIALMEAMATGLPVVATDVGGHSEVLRAGEEGWLINPGDRVALRRAVDELMGSSVERRRRGVAARKAAERIGSPIDNAGRLALILERCAQGAARRSA